MHIFDCIKLVEKNAEKAHRYTAKLEELYQQSDFESMLSTVERGLSSISLLHLSQRELLLSLYEVFPSFPKNIERIEFNALQISVKFVEQFRFPVYQITLPYLIPNKRERKAALKNAITDSVNTAVWRFCKENNIVPFQRSTVIFVSSYEGENLNVDNDNKESSVILNGLIGRFIRDDRASVCNTIYYSKKIEAGAKTDIFITDTDYDIEVYSYIKSR